MTSREDLMAGRFLAGSGWWGKAALGALVLATGIFAALGYQETDFYRDPPQDWGGYDWQEIERQRKEILLKIPGDPEVLVNITADLMPGTPDLTALGRKATRALVRGLLDNADDGVRATCAGVLSHVRDPEAAPALVEGLKDRYEMVRRLSVEGLGNLANPENGKYLLPIIKDPEEQMWVKQTVIDAIGNLGYVQALSTLDGLLKDKDGSLAWNAVSALWHFRNKADRDALVDSFLYVLKEQKPGAEQVVDYLGELKADEASDVLAKFFVGRDEYSKNRVILAMGKIGDGKARKFLKGVMSSTQNARHLNNAAIALGRLGDRKDAIAILVKLLADRKAYMRINAAFALGEIQAVEDVAVDGLMKALSDANDYVRSEASVALGRIKATKAQARLEELASGANPFVALDAVIALNRIDYGKYRHLIFDKLLVHKEPKYRRIVERGIRFLAEQKDPAALPHMLEYLRSWDQVQISSALGLVGEYEASGVGDFKPSFLYLTHTCSYDCLGQVLRNLRKWKFSDYSSALLERLYRVYYGGDKAVIYFTLGKVGKPEIADTVAAIQETDHTAKLYQQFALANLGNEKATVGLIDLVKDGTLPDKRDAAFLLGSMDSKAAVPKLEELMNTGDAFTAVSAASALLGLGHEGAVEYLYKVMKTGTPIVADEAERAFLVSDQKSVEKFLDKVLGQEKDIVTKRRAEEILYQKAPKEFR